MRLPGAGPNGGPPPGPAFTGNRDRGILSGMPPFLRLIPLPRQLTTDLPRPIAAGVGLAVSLPTTAARLAITLPQTALALTTRLVGRYQELADIGVAVLGLRGGGRTGDDEDDEGAHPAYDMDTGAWGAADDEAAVVSLLERHEPTAAEAIAADPRDDARALAAAVEDRAAPPANAPTRADLPIDGYDGLSASALRSRLSGLGLAELTLLRDYEAAHGRRVTVLAMLERAISRAS